MDFQNTVVFVSKIYSSDLYQFVALIYSFGYWKCVYYYGLY